MHCEVDLYTVTLHSKVQGLLYQYEEPSCRMSAVFVDCSLFLRYVFSVGFLLCSVLASRTSFVVKVSLYTSSFHPYSCEVDKKGGD